MDQASWIVVLNTYLKYCSSDRKIKSTDLDEYFMLSNSFNGVFTSSKDYDIKVIKDLIDSIRELIMTEDTFNLKTYALIMGYLNAITSANFNRLEDFWQNILDLFFKLIAPDNELA